MKKLVPPGTRWKRDIIVYIILLILLFLCSLRFPRNNLTIGSYRYVDLADGTQQRILDWHSFGSELKDYFYLFFSSRAKHPIARQYKYNSYIDCSHTFLFSTFYFLYCIYIIIRNYRLMNNGAKSMYLLNRLPNGISGHTRCLFLPLAALLVGTALTALLMCFYSNLIFYLDFRLSFNIWEALL